MTPDKSPDAFRTISEVAGSLDLPQHVLRFWETRFSHIRPLKRGGGRRYYRPEDVELLRGIRHLLYNEGYTIKGVQRILKDQGPRFVMQIWRDDAVTLSAAQAGASDQYRGEKAAGEMTADDSDDRWHRSPPVESEGRTATARNTQADDEPTPRGVLVGDEAARSTAAQRSGLRFMERILGDKPEGQGEGRMSKDDVRKLQATLFELLECKRILDQAR